MRDLTFTERNNPVDQRAISMAESQVGYEFPEDYREFLLRYNGGLAEEGVFDIPGRGQSSVIFFGVDTKESYSDLVLNFNDYKFRLPEKSIPIGFDPGGNLICLVHIGGEWKVYFWDHEKDNDPPVVANMLLLNESFSKFVDSLEGEDNEAW